jgi:hypothetical protein
MYRTVSGIWPTATEGRRREQDCSKPTTVPIPKMTLFRVSTSGRGENNVTRSRRMVDLG